MDILALEDLRGKNQDEVRDHIVESYEANADVVDKFEILIAYESVGSWGCDSSSWFLLRDKATGTLYENHGSHCSCYGFEGQFEPEETSLEAIEKRGEYPFYGGGYDNNEEQNLSAAKTRLNELRSTS